MPNETYICIDVETSGPSPSKYAILSIGACLVDDTDTTFYVELKPDRDDFLPEALVISGLSMPSLVENGTQPELAFHLFSEWIISVVPEGNKPVFVAMNAPFDWMFVCDYFIRYLGYNPFGHSAVDIKAFYMGLTGVSWSETSMKHISRYLKNEKKLIHNALRDAQDQALIFKALLQYSKNLERTNN